MIYFVPACMHLPSGGGGDIEAGGSGAVVKIQNLRRGRVNKEKRKKDYCSQIRQVKRRE
jgi:hypothetical protein